MQDQDKILSFLKATGPTLPAKVAKNIKTDILLASAHLADLSSRNKVRMSNLKVGGSPLYYLEGQEAELYQFAESNINPKNYIVIEKLRKEKVFREAKLDLLSKVALRSLKDFAIPLRVKFEGNEEIFWRWYMLPPEEAKEMITEMLYGKEIPVVEVPKEEEPAIEVKKETPPPIEQKTLMEEEKPEPVKEEPETITEEIKEETPVPVKEELKEEKPKKKKVLQDKLLPVVEEFLTNLDIKVKNQETVRKHTEHNLILEVPSIVGKITYFCKAKSKARCDEKDLSSAYMEAQIKKLPLLFLYSKSITKKALEMLESDAFQNANVKKIE
jgi:hypothetical protein